jgi:hypothetical protein
MRNEPDEINASEAASWTRSHRKTRMMTAGQMAARLGVAPSRVDAVLELLGRGQPEKKRDFFEHPPEVFEAVKRRLGKQHRI